MLRKSLTKISLVGIGNIANAFLGLAFLAAVAKVLDLPSFGKYALLTTLLTSASKIIDFGTNSVFVAKSFTSKWDNLRDSFYSLKLILLGIAIPVLMLAVALSNVMSFTILIVLTLGLFAYTTYYTLYALFQKEEKFTHLVLLNTIPAVIKGTFAALIFLGLFKANLTDAIAIFSLSVFGCTLFFLVLDKNEKTFSFTLQGVAATLKEAYPGGISQFIYEAWPSISNFIAKSARGFYDVGIFSLANKISRLFALISFSIFTVLLPENAARKKDNLSYDFKETIVISLLIILASFMVIPIAELLVYKVFGNKFAESVGILSILIISAGLSSIHTFIENFFFVERKTSYLIYINLGKLSLFLIACGFLVPQFSLYGLAVSDLIASGVAVFGTFWFIKKSQSLEVS